MTARLPHNPAQSFEVVELDEMVEFLDPISLDGQPVPERQWMVPGLIPRRAVTMLGGDGGLGKTLLGQMLITAAATGSRWLGLHATECKTIGLFCEDELDELHRRQGAINDDYQLSFGDLENVRWLPRCGQDSVLVHSPDGGACKPTDLWPKICDAVSEFGAQLVLLDSLHDLFAGNENNRNDARAFISMLRGLAIEIDGAVIMTAHPSLSGLSSGSGLSGSTAWNNAVRSRLYLTKPSDASDEAERELSTMKANYAGTGDKIPLVWQGGVFVRSDGDALAYTKHAKADRVFLECLDEQINQGRYVNDAKSTDRYAPKVFARMHQADGLKVKDFEATKERLFSQGRIKIDYVGKHANRSAIRGIVRTNQAHTPHS